MSDHRKSRQRDRLKDALRENLKRRKAQAKGRTEKGPAEVARTGDEDERGSADRNPTDRDKET